MVGSHGGEAFGMLAFDAPLASIDFTTRSADAKDHGEAARGAVFAATTVPAIPEPHTNLLMLAGLAAIGFMAMRRRRP
jgi:PEP-CTERM motif